MPSTLRARLSAALATAASVALVVGGCAVGPDTGPDVVRGDRPAADDTQTTKQPELAVPARELNWRDCTGRIADDYDVDLDDRFTVECATYDMPIDAARPRGEDVRIGALRLRTDKTPDQAPPLVLTSGTDLPSSRVLVAMAQGAGAAAIDRNPIVAVDYRGTGLGGAVDCLTDAQRGVLAADAAGRGRDVERRAEATATAARAAADLCTETLSPNQLAFSTDAAAGDLEGLRDRWGVERLGLIGVGDGTSIALRYAAVHADRVGRLVLDSPVGYGVPAKEAAAARARGVQKSLDVFAQRCASAGCGPDVAAVLNRLVTAGAAGDLAGLADTQVLDAVQTALAVGDTSPTGLKALGAALTAADRGDTAALRRLADDAAALRATDGRLVGVCNDLRGRPGLQEIPGLVRDWSADAGTTALTTALDLVRCDGWGGTDAPGPPTSFAVQPLILVGANDPYHGRDAADQLSATMVAADAAPSTVSWDGLGYSVLAHSACAADVLGQYLGDEPLRESATRACPA